MEASSGDCCTNQRHIHNNTKHACAFSVHQPHAAVSNDASKQKNTEGMAMTSIVQNAQGGADAR